ncbi:MAG: hypothetical protein J6T48_01565 [Bacteroidales bacterium]|nr:hypothetical protein [Bacteroidales bacterium]
MKKLVAILLLVCAVNMAYTQFFDNTLVKTRPFKFFFNPNVGLEKPISSMFSITSEVAYHKFDNFVDGSIKGQYFDNDWFGYPSKVKFNGVEIALGARMYLMTLPNKYLDGYYWIAPFGLYYEVNVDYSHSWAYEVQIYDYGRSVYYDVNWPYYRADVRLDNLSIVMLIGYQHNFKNTLSIDFNVGARYYCISKDSREVLSVNPTYDDVAVGEVIRNENRRWQIAGRFTLGYYIRYDWMKRKK